VVFSVFAFARERDRAYVVVTLIVLGLLFYGLARFHLRPARVFNAETERSQR
jgi:uncharacterized membrane protein